MKLVYSSNTKESLNSIYLSDKLSNDLELRKSLNFVLEYELSTLKNKSPFCAKRYSVARLRLQEIRTILEKAQLEVSYLQLLRLRKETR